MKILVVAGMLLIPSCCCLFVFNTLGWFAPGMNGADGMMIPIKFVQDNLFAVIIITTILCLITSLFIGGGDGDEDGAE